MPLAYAPKLLGGWYRERSESLVVFDASCGGYVSFLTQSVTVGFMPPQTPIISGMKMRDLHSG